jgi:hypothetical protein
MANYCLVPLRKLELANHSTLRRYPDHASATLFLDIDPSNSKIQCSNLGHAMVYGNLEIVQDRTASFNPVTKHARVIKPDGVDFVLKG